MRLLLHSTNSPAQDLALEEAIQSAVEEGLSANTWRLWQAAVPCVVLGTGLEAAKEAALDAARAEGIAVLRRHSGGGAVVIGPGVLNYSAFYLLKDLPGSETIRGAMSAALKPIISLLAAWGLRACEMGLSDLALACAGGELRKIAGNAQARKRRSVLIHGSLLADPDLELMARVLRYPSAAPEYRARRGHSAFLTSLREQGAPHDLASLAAGLARALECSGSPESEPSAEEQRRAAKLLAEKYGTAEWNFRR
jgi:lipoate-protein ligase A